MLKKIGIILIISTIISLAFGIVGCKTGPIPTPAPPASKPPSSPSPSLTAPLEVIKWRLQSSQAPTSLHKVMSKVFMEEVEKNSSGRLKIEFYEQGAIIGINELFDGVSKGTVEMGLGSALFEMGVLPEAEVEWGLPGSFDRYQDYWDFWFTYKDGTAVKILDAAYKERGIHYLTMDPAIMGIYTKFSIRFGY